MDKRLFSFLKDRKIFTDGGHKSFREYMDAKERNTEWNDRARKGHKKAKHK
ncbi:MAG: hypothetical protein JJE45_00290 [Prolixibacteraceae bacterium]|nr:hypothetical protein [Prolixibacteraceae bacterium]